MLKSNPAIIISIIHCSGHLSSHWLRACFKFWISGNRSSYLLADIFSVLRSNPAIIISTMHCTSYGSFYWLRACSNDWISGDLSSYLLVDISFMICCFHTAPMVFSCSILIKMLRSDAPKCLDEVSLGRLKHMLYVNSQCSIQCFLVICRHFTISSVPVVCSRWSDYFFLGYLPLLCCLISLFSEATA